MTIAQLREREVDRLEEITKDRRTACNLMNRYYRLAALEMRLLELTNDERFYNKPWVLRDEEKAERWRERLKADFNAYGLDLKYAGITGTICEYTPDDNRIGREIIGRHFY